MLLGAQLLQVLAWPFLGGSTLGGAFLGVIGMLAVGSAVLAVRRTPHVSRVVFFLGAPTIVFTLLEAVFSDVEPVVLVSGLLHAPFYFYVSYAMLRYLFHDEEVTTDEYYATGAAFTVVAWGFAHLYASIQVVWPDSFANAGDNGVPSGVRYMRRQPGVWTCSIASKTGSHLSTIPAPPPNGRSSVVACLSFAQSRSLWTLISSSFASCARPSMLSDKNPSSMAGKSVRTSMRMGKIQPIKKARRWPGLQ